MIVRGFLLPECANHWNQKNILKILNQTVYHRPELRKGGHHIDWKRLLWKWLRSRKKVTPLFKNAADTWWMQKRNKWQNRLPDHSKRNRLGKNIKSRLKRSGKLTGILIIAIPTNLANEKVKRKIIFFALRKQKKSIETKPTWLWIWKKLCIMRFGFAIVIELPLLLRSKSEGTC